MNIPIAAKNALIPIEQKICSENVEHLYQLDKNGQILSHTIGDEHSVKSKDIKDCFLSVHNHPNGAKKFSVSDLINSISDNEREARIVTKDRFCHLVEIPHLNFLKKIKCYYIIIKRSFDKDKYLYQCKLNNINLSAVQKAKINNKFYRDMTKELEQKIGLKFRTIKLPE